MNRPGFRNGSRGGFLYKKEIVFFVLAVLIKMMVFYLQF